MGQYHQQLSRTGVGNTVSSAGEEGRTPRPPWVLLSTAPGTPPPDLGGGSTKMMTTWLANLPDRFVHTKVKLTVFLFLFTVPGKSKWRRKMYQQVNCWSLGPPFNTCWCVISLG